MTTNQLHHDPVIAEIHAIREQLAQQYHNDLIAYSETAEAHCRAMGFTWAKSPREIKLGEAPKHGVAS